MSAAQVKSTQDRTEAPGGSSEFLSPDKEPSPLNVERPETTAATVKENRSASQRPVAAPVSLLQPSRAPSAYLGGFGSSLLVASAPVADSRWLKIPT